MDPILLGEILAGLMFFGIIGFLMLGFPVAFTLAGVSLMFGLVGIWLGVFDPSNFGSLAARYIGFMTNEVLVAVPLFIFMGVMLERSKIAEQLLLTMGKLFGNMRGGLGISVIIVGALLAASTGVVGATVVTMGLISLPAMLRAGYDPRLASGVICASGTLGQINSAIDRADLHGRHAVGHQRAGADGQGQFRPDAGLGRRPVRRCPLSRPAAGRPLSDLDGGQGDILARILPGNARPARGKEGSGPRGRGRASAAAGADQRGARLHPGRHRHTDGSRFRRRGRRDGAGGAALAAVVQGGARGHDRHRDHHLDGLHHPVWRIGLSRSVFRLMGG